MKLLYTIGTAFFILGLLGWLAIIILFPVAVFDAFKKPAEWYDYLFFKALSITAPLLLIGGFLCSLTKHTTPSK